MGRARSRRRRGKTGGQGSGGSGTGKGRTGGGMSGRSGSRRRRGKTGGVGSGGSGTGTGKGTGGSPGRSRHTRGGQHKANKNQNEKARSAVNSVKKAVQGGIKGLAANAATRIANSPMAHKYNRTTVDRSQLTPQQIRRREALGAITGRDYFQRQPSFNINLSADRLAQIGGFQDAGWYTGLTNRFPGIRSLRINKQLYSNPMQKGWHSSQRLGKGNNAPGLGSIGRAIGRANNVPGLGAVGNLVGTPGGLGVPRRSPASASIRPSYRHHRA